MANLPNPSNIDWRAMLGAITVIVVGIIMLVVGLGGAGELILREKEKGGRELFLSNVFDAAMLLRFLRRRMA